MTYSLKKSALSILIITSMVTFSSTYAIDWIGKIKAIVAWPANILWRNVILIESAQTGDIARVQELLSLAGIDVNTYDYTFNRTPLMAAAFCGHTTIVEMLVAHGAQINFSNKWKDTALMSAARLGHRQIIEILLAAQAEVNVQDTYGETALIIAVNRGDIEIVHMLIAAHANLQLRNQHNFSAYDLAILHNHTTIADLLKQALDAENEEEEIMVKPAV